MKILLANPRGFCAGVDRAIDIVERAIELFGAPIYVRHEVVHNRFVVERLRGMGAVFVDELDEVLGTRPVLNGMRLPVLRETRMPAVLLTDIEMPRMDGFELTMRVRQDARSAAVPIVIISSRTADKHRSRAQQIGVNAFLGKPGDMTHFRQINTFGGHTVSTAVAMRNVQIVEDEDLTGNAARMGKYFRDQMAAEVGDHPFVGEIRGLGLLNGIELVEDRQTKAPLPEAKLNVVTGTAIQSGVFLGRNSNTVPGRCNVLLIAPPLVINQSETDQIVAAIKKGLTAAMG